MAAISHLQGLSIIPSTLTNVALHIDVWQEIHLDDVDTLPPTGLATPPFDIETELPHLITPGLGLHRGGKHLANRIEGAGVGGWIGAGRAPDRALVNDDHLVDRLDPPQLLQAGRERHLESKLVFQGRVQQLIHQGALTAATHPGHRHQAPQGNINIDAAKVIAVAINKPQPPAARLPATGGGGDGAAATEIGAGKGVFGLEQILQRPLGDDMAAVDAGAGANIDEVIGGTDGVLVVFDNYQSVAQVAQLGEGGKQAVVIPLVQADAGFIQHVQDSSQAGADLGGEANALGLTAREGHGGPIQAEVIQAHVQQKTQAHANLSQHQITDLDLALRQEGGGPGCGADPHQSFDAGKGFGHTDRR